MIVTFYSNFRFEDVDVSHLNLGGFGSGSEIRVCHVHEEINQAFENPKWPGEEPRCLTEPVGESDFDENRTAFYANTTIDVLASGGTWKFKVLTFGGEEFIESGPIAYNASAAEVLAAIPEEFRDPGAFSAFRITKLGDGGNCGPGGQEEVAPEAWIGVVELEAGRWELRFYVDGGTHAPGGFGMEVININLGSVIESLPFHDEKEYVVPLEEGCIGGAPPPAGSIEPLGAASGSKEHSRPISGNGQ
jgi:hypothetical protein